MTALLTAAQAQAYGVGLDFDPTSLQALIDLEALELVRRFGDPTAARTEEIEGGGKSLYLIRAVSAVSAVTEYLYVGDPAPRTLASVDYHVWADRGRLQRLWTGTTGAGRWGNLVSVTYTPVDDTSLRTQVLVELARIATEQTAGGAGVSGLSFSISARNADATGAGWANQRAVQYARLGWLSR